MKLTSIRLSAYQVAFMLLALVFCTYLRISLLLIYPLVVVGVFYLLNWRLDRNGLYILGWVALCWILSFRDGFYPKYNILSFYYFIPFILLLFAVPQKTSFDVRWRKEYENTNFLRLLMNSLTVLIIMNDVAGIIQYARNPGDDNFVGLYGSFTVSQNGLSIINSILFFYHLTVYQHRRKNIHLILCGFFIICSVLGFYGAGMMVLMVALVLTYLKLRKKNILQLVFLTFFTLSIVVVLMKLISPNTYDYNVAIIERFLSPNAANAPRKLIAFKNYFEGYTSNLADMLFGSGPGTFNSRSAFMVGSPSYFYFDPIKSAAQPHYFKNYAYPLWNASNTGPYDGFMNQPFSSILALLGEFGLIFTMGLFVLMANRFKYFSKLSNKMARSAGVSIEAKMYRFISIYALLLIIIDNYMEYPEIIGLVIIIIKLSQQELRRAFDV